MAIKGITTTFTLLFISIGAAADSGIIMLAPSESVKRSDWQSMGGGGWAASPMPAPKIILLKNEESTDGGDKEGKLESLLPLIMTVGPLILMAILLPVFMSLLSGIMGFVKSLLAMKMPMMNVMPMMPVMPVLPQQINGMPQGLMDAMQKPVFIGGRKHNNSILDRFLMNVDDMVYTKNMSVFRIPGV